MLRASILGAAAAIVIAVGCQDRSLHPIHPCLVSVASSQLRVDPLRNVDLLFMIDNSGSMSQEQMKLRQEIPRLVRILATGDTDEDGLPGPDPAVESLHVGFVTSNMGSNGVNPPTVSTCTGLGQDGVLQSRAVCGVGSPVLQFNQGNDIESFINNVQCMADLGTDGCGVEQQLDAMLKAVTPSSQQIFYAASGGHADGANAGFIRDDALLAIVLVTDEEDCSTSALEPFDVSNSANSGIVNVLCNRARQAGTLHPMARYVDALRQIKDPQSLVFGVIAGVPPELSSTGTPDFDAILNHADMQPVEIDSATYSATYPGEAPRSLAMRPVCSVPDYDGDGRLDTIADPARRMVELAKELDGIGAGTVVQSICQDSFKTALDSILARIITQLNAGCLPRPLVADSAGEVRCRVIEELPPGMGCAAAGPNRSSLGFTSEGKERCEIGQVPVFANTPTAGTSGWFYDDFSPDRLESCQIRINFTPDARPLSGVLLRLECLDPVSESDTTITVGTDCSDDPNVCQLADANILASYPRGLICNASKNICEATCGNNADCPIGQVCGDAGYCLNPTCDP